MYAPLKNAEVALLLVSNLCQVQVVDTILGQRLLALWFHTGNCDRKVGFAWNGILSQLPTVIDSHTHFCDLLGCAMMHWYIYILLAFKDSLQILNNFSVFQVRVIFFRLFVLWFFCDFNLKGQVLWCQLMEIKHFFNKSVYFSSLAVEAEWWVSHLKTTS